MVYVYDGICLLFKKKPVKNRGYTYLKTAIQENNVIRRKQLFIFKKTQRRAPTYVYSVIVSWHCQKNWTVLWWCHAVMDSVSFYKCQNWESFAPELDKSRPTFEMQTQSRVSECGVRQCPSTRRDAVWPAVAAAESISRHSRTCSIQVDFAVIGLGCLKCCRSQTQAIDIVTRTSLSGIVQEIMCPGHLLHLAWILQGSRGAATSSLQLGPQLVSPIDPSGPQFLQTPRVRPTECLKWLKGNLSELLIRQHCFDVRLAERLSLPPAPTPLSWPLYRLDLTEMTPSH